MKTENSPHWLPPLKAALDEATGNGPEYPVWLDGFRDVLVRGHTALVEDNPYDPEKEACLHRSYRKGALAAESLLGDS